MTQHTTENHTNSAAITQAYLDAQQLWDAIPAWPISDTPDHSFIPDQDVILITWTTEQGPQIHLSVSPVS